MKHILLICFAFSAMACSAFAAKYADVQGGVVVATRSASYAGYIACPDDVECGWLYDGAVFTKGAAVTAAEAAAADLAAKRAALTAAIATMRTWSDDADAAVGNWDGWTTAQRFAAMKTTLTRLAVFFDRFADLIETQ